LLNVRGEIFPNQCGTSTERVEKIGKKTNEGYARDEKDDKDGRTARKVDEIIRV